MGSGIMMSKKVLGIHSYLEVLTNCQKTDTIADPQSLLEEKEALEEKLALSEYALRLAQEDTLKLKANLQKKTEFTLDELTGTNAKFSANNGADSQQEKRETSFLTWTL
ncbi:hypothetical protein LOK49_LG08G00427 [Camellia lanceoleosa]|uniref:Uncharacterized protein n=1 Tax=Camellia lanceoleosa TaxID=1840588 RepID=A0ACC0GRJ5_9ERIC|nr:hypothetical protein LOK49_LG08G00427 [Camellia lanceoleosa]